MVETSMNIFDLVVLTVIGLSALLSFFRGFMREVLSLLSWAGAAIITLYMFPHASKLIEPQVKSAVIASGLASIGVFFVALILISILTGMIAKYVKSGSEIGLVDNLIGLCFGIARGVLIVALGYFIMTIVMVEKDYPDWITESKSRPYVAKAAKWVASITPSYLDTITGDEAKKKLERDAEDDGDLKSLYTSNKKKAKKLAEEKADELDEKLDDMPDSLPSMEDLQQRIREENERNN